MLTRLRVYLWARRRRTLLGKHAEAAALYRHACHELLAHEARHPLRPKPHAVPTHRLWRSQTHEER